MRRLRQEKRPVRFLASRILWHSRLASIIPLYAEGQGFKLRFFPSSVSASFWLDPSFRRTDESIVRSCLRPGDVAVDVGANVGTMTLLMASCVGSDGSVVSFEPHPRIFRFLHHNVGQNGFTVELHNIALGDEDDFAGFSDTPLDDYNRPDEAGDIRVPMMKLDTIMGEGEQRIALLKVDVEGYELFVLRGAVSTLSRTDRLYIEVNDQHFAEFGYSTVDLLTLIRNGGFYPWRWDGARFTEVTGDYAAGGTENLLCVRSGVRLPDLPEGC